MSSAFPDGPDGSFVPETKMQGQGTYGMSSTGSKEEAEETRKEWSGVQDEQFTPEELRRQETRDDQAFEDQTRAPGTSDASVPDSEKGIAQRVYDNTVGKLNTEAAKEYLAS